MLAIDGKLKGDTVRYLISGAFVTIAGTLLLTILLGFISYPFAYTFVFVASVIANALLHSLFVFRRKLKGRIALVFGSLLAQYLVGIAGLYILIDVLQVPRVIAPWINLCVCVPINFLMSRIAFYAEKDTFARIRKCFHVKKENS